MYFFIYFSLNKKFTKTNLLQPNQEETVELKIDVNDFTSYDCYDKNNNKHKIIIASINIMNTSVTLIECKFQCYLEISSA